MAALDMHEQEQVDALRAWWKDNGTTLILAVVLAAVVTAGVLGWKYWKGSQQADAAVLFGEVVKQMGSNDPKRVGDAAAILAGKYASSIYAGRAQLLAAQMNLDAKNTAAAASQLQWVIDHGADDLANIARLKLASLQLDEKKYDEALKLVDAPHSESFDGLYLDIKGDVYTAQGKKDEARAAFKQALDKTDTRSRYRSIIQMKLDGLGGAGESGKSSGDKAVSAGGAK